MKKKTKTSQHLRFPSWRSLLLGYAVFVSTIVGVVLFIFISVYEAQQRSFADMTFKQLVRDTQLAMYQSPNRLDERVIFPDMKLSMPATSDTRGLLYEYQEAINEPGVDMAASASFASKSAVYNTSKHVEQLTCTRLVDVTFGQKDADRGGENFPFVEEKLLSDGRMMYIYQNKSNCTNVWSGINSESLVKLLLQADATN